MKINYITVAIIVIKHFLPTFSIHAPKDIKKIDMNFCGHSERHLRALLKNVQQERTFMPPYLPGAEVNDGDRLRAGRQGVLGPVGHQCSSPLLVFIYFIFWSSSPC